MLSICTSTHQIEMGYSNKMLDFTLKWKTNNIQNKPRGLNCKIVFIVNFPISSFSSSLGRKLMIRVQGKDRIDLLSHWFKYFKLAKWNGIILRWYDFTHIMLKFQSHSMNCKVVPSSNFRMHINWRKLACVRHSSVFKQRKK